MNKKHLNEWEQQIKSKQIPGLDEMIYDTIKSQRSHRYMKTKIVFAFGFSLILLFALLVNLNPLFYLYAKSNPILAPIAEMIRFENRQEVGKAFDEDYAQKTDITLKLGNIEAKIDYVILDTFSISLFYRFYDQGVLIEESSDINLPRINITQTDGSQLGALMSAGYHMYQGYRWMDVQIELGQISETMNLYLSDDQGNKSEIQQISIDPQIYIPSQRYTIHRSIEIEKQKVFLESVEIGALETRFILKTDLENSRKIIGFNILYLQDGNEVKWLENTNDGSTFTFILAGGQLNKPDNASIQITEVLMLSRRSIPITIDLATNTIQGLPTTLSYEVRTDDIRDGSSIINVHFVNQNQKNIYLVYDPKGLTHAHSMSDTTTTDWYIAGESFKDGKLNADLYEIERVVPSNLKFELAKTIN